MPSDRTPSLHTRPPPGRPLSWDSGCGLISYLAEPPDQRAHTDQREHDNARVRAEAACSHRPRSHPEGPDHGPRCSNHILTRENDVVIVHAPVELSLTSISSLAPTAIAADQGPAPTLLEACTRILTTTEVSRNYEYAEDCSASRAVARRVRRPLPLTHSCNIIRSRRRAHFPGQPRCRYRLRYRQPRHRPTLPRLRRRRRTRAVPPPHDACHPACDISTSHSPVHGMVTASILRIRRIARHCPTGRTLAGRVPRLRRTRSAPDVHPTTRRINPDRRHPFSRAHSLTISERGRVRSAASGNANNLRRGSSRRHRALARSLPLRTGFRISSRNAETNIARAPEIPGPIARLCQLN